jgi:hypothetical protein
MIFSLGNAFTVRDTAAKFFHRANREIRSGYHAIIAATAKTSPQSFIRSHDYLLQTTTTATALLSLSGHHRLHQEKNQVP